MEVNRDDLSRHYKEKLNHIDEKIRLEWENFASASPFERLKIAARMEEFMQEADGYISLLHILDEDFNDKSYKQRFKKYTKAVFKAKKDLKIKIVNDENSESLASLVRESLSDAGIHLSRNNYNVVIKITTKAKKKRYRSTNPKFKNVVFALRKTVIRAYDRDGNVISNVVYKTKEGSSDGFEDAIAKTAKYEKKIAQMGIIDFLTGNK